MKTWSWMFELGVNDVGLTLGQMRKLGSEIRTQELLRAQETI